MANTHVRRGRGGGFRGGNRGGSNGRPWQPKDGNGPDAATASHHLDLDNAEGDNDGGYRDDFGGDSANRDEIEKLDAMDAKMGFLRYQEGPERLGWLVNMHPVGL